MFVARAVLERMLEEGLISLPPAQRKDVLTFDPAKDDMLRFLNSQNLSQPYRIWVARWCKALLACQRMGGNVTPLHIERPATEEEVKEVERQLRQKLPLSLRRTFLEFSSGFYFGWSLWSKVSAPFGVYSGGFEGIKLSWLVDLEEDRQGWIRHVFSDPDNPYDSVWYDKLAIISVYNGDMIAIDQKDADGCVIYLSHDGDEASHGLLLGKNFYEFMEHWSSLGCVGPASWELEHFVDADGINSRSVAANSWRQWFGLEP